MVEITDRKSAEKWFETQPQDICVSIASRAALRGVGGLGHAPAETYRGLALPVFRTMITSAVAATCPTADVEVKKAAFSASSAASSSAAFSSAAFSASAASARSAASSAVSTDASRAEKLAADVAAESLLSLPLWHEDPEPQGLQRGRAKLFDFFDTDPATWGFWKDWYLKMYHQGAPNWDLCRELALIPDDIWKKGPEAVAREIERIEAKYDMLAKIAELEGHIQRFQFEPANRHGIGGNAPPPEEQLDLTEEIRAELGALRGHVQALTAALEGLKTEAAKEEPDKDAVRTWAAFLWEKAEALAAFCLELCKDAAKAAVKPIGTAAGTAIVAEIAGVRPEMIELIKGISKGAITWIGGP